MSQRYRLLLADDHTLLRQGLSSLLGMAPDMLVVGEAADGEEALEKWRVLRPDVVLMDIRMAGADGLTAAERIIAIDPSAGVVILSTYDGEDDIYRAVRGGVRGYLLKDVQSDELLTCVRTVCKGGTYLPMNISSKLASRIRIEDLTERELQILERVAAGDANKVIARRFDIGEGTVKTHLRAILSKLDATSRTEAIAIAQRRGLIRL